MAGRIFRRRNSLFHARLMRIRAFAFSKKGFRNNDGNSLRKNDDLRRDCNDNRQRTRHKKNVRPGGWRRGRREPDMYNHSLPQSARRARRDNRLRRRHKEQSKPSETRKNSIQKLNFVSALALMNYISLFVGNAFAVCGESFLRKI